MGRRGAPARRGPHGPPPVPPPPPPPPRRGPPPPAPFPAWTPTPWPLRSAPGRPIGSGTVPDPQPAAGGRAPSAARPCAAPAPRRQVATAVRCTCWRRWTTPLARCWPNARSVAPRGGLRVQGSAPTPARTSWRPCLRNLVIGVLCRTGPVNVAAALRRHARDPRRPLATPRD